MPIYKVFHYLVKQYKNIINIKKLSSINIKSDFILLPSK